MYTLHPEIKAIIIRVVRTCASDLKWMKAQKVTKNRMTKVFFMHS